MLLVMECVIACALFALVILWTQYKAPIKYIMSYPPEYGKGWSLCRSNKRLHSSNRKRSIYPKR